MNHERREERTFKLCPLYQIYSNRSVNVSNEMLSKFVTANFRFGIAFIICIICPFSFIKNSSESMDLVSKVGKKKGDTSFL